MPMIVNNNTWHPDGFTEPSPLDQIRRVEAEVAHRIAAAQQTADQSKTVVLEQCAAIQREAQENCLQRGETYFDEAARQVRADAKALITRAQQQAHNLRVQSKLTMTIAVRGAVELILGMGIDEI